MTPPPPPPPPLNAALYIITHLSSFFIVNVEISGRHFKVVPSPLCVVVCVIAIVGVDMRVGNRVKVSHVGARKVILSV